MKMKIKLIFTWCYLLFILINHKSSIFFASAKNLEAQNIGKCSEHIGRFFKSILNVTIHPSTKVGEICGGNCCDNKTEKEILEKSIKKFEENVKYQLKSLKGFWESTFTIYKDHVLELSYQSENKTLNLFSTVYRRMSPLSRSPILELYKSIRSHISLLKPLYEDELDATIDNFFRNLFPLAYHHAVHSRDADDDAMARDFHIDYKNCLEKSYDALQPFGEIPFFISRMLLQSVGGANVFLRSLDHGASILTATENLPFNSPNRNCQQALLKMNYCASCNGHNYHHIKPCYGLCSNVIRNQNKSFAHVTSDIFHRGCVTQFLGDLDTDWNSFSEDLERLMTLIRNKDGIESVIKNLDGKLSEAIMHAMTNGPELEKKVLKSCGIPSIRRNDKIPSYDSSKESNEKNINDGPSLEKKQVPPVHNGNKWAPPPDTEMLLFLTHLDQSKSLTLRLANSYCDDDRYQMQDRDCWTGSNLGDYTHKVMDIHSQKYNPEVPTLQSINNDQLHQLNDQLITMKNMVNKQMTHLLRSDSDKMFADMAEGSTNYHDLDHDYDDERYEDEEMSGSGESNYDPLPPNFQPGVLDDNNHNRMSPGSPASSGSSNKVSLVTVALVLFSIIVINLNRYKRRNG
ncbi:CLUMA_CG006270, isoform A [Clunio marinus]|uniref:CLUMA_CG006270, isoform A n=1 Tax=Clunio marinus TaxID=568069 RepID=A0A1J1HX35_9DIPT|nr:CLUMA_CG006270, isoform A [Clunio marinus]